MIITKKYLRELNANEKNGENLLHETSTYVFTRTNCNGQVEYGYCRRFTYNKRITKFPVVICIGYAEIFITDAS